MLRLLVCDDSPEAREAVRAVLSTQRSLEIVGEAANGEEAVELATSLAPDVVLMDVSMPIVDGVAATRRIRELLPETRVVALAGSEDTDVVMAMMDAGASAYCAKGAPIWELERAIGGAGEPLLRLAHGLARSSVDCKGELVTRELIHLTEAMLAAIYLTRPDGGLALAGLAGSERRKATLAERLASRALNSGTIVHAARSLAVPLVADGDTVGALAVVGGAQRELDPELLASVADLAAAAFVADGRLARSRDEARRDALTGLANRRAFEERLEQALLQANGRRRETSVLLLDLDDFKRINDTRGHAAGDEVLRQVGLVIVRTVRADDAVFRFGGEEFAIVVDGGVDAARLVAERIQAALRRQRRGERLPTFSAGIASVPLHAQDQAELVRKADAALYAAKWAGKNRVLTYCAEVETSPDLRTPPAVARSPRVLIVDDDPGLRALLRTTLEPVDLEVDEAANAAAASSAIAAHRPDVVVLDIRMPGLDGLAFCAQLKSDPAMRDAAVVLLTGDEGRDAEGAARAAGADGFLRKPFSPLELLELVEGFAHGRRSAPLGAAAERPAGGQVQLYAQDLRRVLEIERGQRVLLQKAYREAVTALATALESKDTGTKAHSQRVQRYALRLASEIEPGLLDDPSLEYGFLLHDVGKIGIPDRILLKPARLTAREERLMRTHTVLGEQMLGEVALLQGEGLRVVRSHHERWDGSGYPDGLARRTIPIGARIFAVADTLDAITSDRPYRRAGDWQAAVAEVERQAGSQFDPDVVEAFLRTEPALRQIHDQLAAA